jgi:hypothetical protein
LIRLILPTLVVLGMGQSETTIGVSADTHELIKSRKRGGESFDTLLQRMCEQYDPGERR